MYLFDSSIMIELSKGNEHLAKQYGEEPVLTINLAYGEIYYYGLKTNLPLKEIDGLAIQCTNYDLDDIKKAMHLLYTIKKRTRDFSFIDAVLYTVAEKNKLTLLTKDKDFKGLPHVECIDA